MRHGAKAVAVLALVIGLAACGKQEEQGQTGGNASEAATPVTETAPTSKPPAAFAQCMSCHSVEPGKNGIGPSLHGVVGRKAASLPGFAYSPALRNSGLTWDEATLDKWLTNPMKDVPGTKMIFAGLPDAAKRKEVIDYLAAQK
jgi:cytochrome c